MSQGSLGLRRLSSLWMSHPRSVGARAGASVPLSFVGQSKGGAVGGAGPGRGWAPRPRSPPPPTHTETEEKRSEGTCPLL